MQVSRMAMLMEAQGFPSLDGLPDGAGIYFIPSACWRKIAPSILSTTRFVGMLVDCGLRLAVYDIGDGSMEWQIRAESSLFYAKYGSYETRATEMILICKNGHRDKVARNIIRQTMWNRRQLLSDTCLERNRPTRWSRSPIKLLPAHHVQGHLLGMTIQKLIQRKVASFDLVSCDQAPLGKNDGRSICLAERQCVSAEDVLLQNKPHGLSALAVSRLSVVSSVGFIPKGKQAGAALGGVIWSSSTP